jgi:hypothetical protein
VTDAALPLATEILYSTTPAQRAELEKTMPRESEEWIRSWLKGSTDERRERWRNEATDFVQDYIGRPNDDQKLLLERTSLRYRPDEELWLAYRKAWQRELMRILTESGGYGEFATRFRSLSTERSRWYGPEYADVFDGNQRLYRELAIALVASMTEAQHARLQEKLLSLAEDLEALAGELPPPPAPLGCFVSCSAPPVEVGSLVPGAIDRFRVEHDPRDDVRDHDQLRHHQAGDDGREPNEKRVEVEVPGEPGAHAA